MFFLICMSWNRLEFLGILNSIFSGNSVRKGLTETLAEVEAETLGKTQ